MGKYADQFEKISATVPNASPAYVACMALYGAQGHQIGIIAPNRETLAVAWKALAGFGGLQLDIARIQQVVVFSEGAARQDSSNTSTGNPE